MRGEGAATFHALDYNRDGTDDYVTEYWFNDSQPGFYASGGPWQYGVSDQRIAAIEHPEEVIWSIDAIDWVPRHTGESNLLWGDGRVRNLKLPEYEFPSDPYGAPGPFFNWGHYYPSQH